MATFGMDVLTRDDIVRISKNIEEHNAPIIPECLRLFAGGRSATWQEDGYRHILYPKTRSKHNVTFIFDNFDGDAYVDLSRSRLYAELEVQDENGDPYEQLHEDFAVPIDFIMQTMWEDVRVSIGQKVVCNSDLNYSYSSYLQYLLNVSKETKEHQGSFMGWTGDSGYFNQHDAGSVDSFNSGLLNRRNFMAQLNSKGYQTNRFLNTSVEYYGYFFNGIGNQGRYILHSTPMKFEMVPKNDDYTLLTTKRDSKAKLVIKKIQLELYMVQIAPRWGEAINILFSGRNKENKQVLENPLPVRYPMQKIKVVKKHFPSNSTTYQFDDVFTGLVPSRMVVGHVLQSAYLGDKQQNPFYFQHFNMKSISVTLNNKIQKLEVDFNKGKYMQGLVSLYEVAGRDITDTDIGITRINYQQGHTLFGFTFDSTAQENSAIYGIPKFGNVRVEAHFDEIPPDPVFIIFFGTFGEEFRMGKARLGSLASDGVTAG